MSRPTGFPITARTARIFWWNVLFRPGQFDPFFAELRKIIPDNHADLLNVTVRDVNRDDDSFLRYADKNLISLVMLFSQKRDAPGEERMSTLTQEIVAAALQA